MKIVPKTPHDASLQEVRDYVRWMDSVTGLGWKDEDLQGLSDLWWKHHPPVNSQEPTQPKDTPCSKKGEM